MKVSEALAERHSTRAFLNKPVDQSRIAQILEQASRSSHYSKEDYETLAFEGSPPDAKSLGHTWRSMLCEAADMAKPVEGTQS